MLVENQKAKVKWSKNNKQWYMDKGYVFTQYKDEFDVDVNDLTHGSHIKVDVVCDYCGKIIKVAWRDYLRYEYDKYSCKHCRQRKTSEYNLNERQDYLYNGALKTCEENGYTLLTPKEYILNSASRVEYLCDKHGTNKTKIYTLLLGHGCPQCAYESNGNNAKLDIDFVEKRINECGGTWLNKNEYTGWADKNLLIRCPMCGEPFVTSYNSFTHRGGQFCPSCTKVHSVGENKIEEYLVSYGIPFEREYRFYNCKDKIRLPFDFYIKTMDICIEFNGRQHYESIAYFGGDEHFQIQKKHDEIKRQYCQDNGIYLLVIPYWDIDDIDNILDEVFNLHEDIV